MARTIAQIAGPAIAAILSGLASGCGSDEVPLAGRLILNLVWDAVLEAMR